MGENLDERQRYGQGGKKNKVGGERANKQDKTASQSQKKGKADT